MIFCLFISRTTFSGGDGWVFFQLSRLQKLYKSRIFPNSSFQNEDACWFPSTDGWSLLLKYNDVMFWTVDQTENGFFLISYWDFLQSFLKSPTNYPKQLYLNGSKMNHLSQTQWMIFSYLLPNVFKLFDSFRYFFQTSIYFTWRRREEQNDRED